MRRVLVNHAVSRHSEKRGTGQTLLRLDEATSFSDRREVNLILLDEARSHLLKAQEDSLNLRRKNELGKNYEHRLTLISAELDRTAQRGNS